MSIAAGCAKRSPEATSPGAEMDRSDELAQLEQQLAQRERQLESVGYRLPGGATGRTATTATTATPARDDGGRSPEAHGGAPSSAPSEPPAPMAEAAATKQADAEDLEGGGRCQQICEISAAICSLEASICGLVPRHPDDERYQAACTRAAEDCRFATEACHACS
jgi:hypothetical protein